MWCDFFPHPLLKEGLSVFHVGWEARREEWKGCYDTVHLTFTHIHNTWYMASQRILLNLYCSWGQALNSPLKEHNGSSDRAHGISVYRAGLRLFHPVQDVTSCRRFFLQKCCWPELFAAVWLTHESVRWEQAEQAAPPCTPSIRDSAGSLSRVRSVGFHSNSHIRTEEIPNHTSGWKMRTGSISKKQIPNEWLSVNGSFASTDVKRSLH